MKFRDEYRPSFALAVTDRAATTCLFLALAVLGCDSSPQDQQPTASAAPPTRVAEASGTYRQTPGELRSSLRANEKAKFEYRGNQIVRAELYQSGIRSIEALREIPLEYIDLGSTDVTDLSPLEGMPLRELILEDTPVTDISVLRGMPLKGLKLQNTSVTDLSPLYDMQLSQLNLMGIPVEDISPFARMPLETLWLPKTRVRDLTPLSSVRLVSLDVQDTPVSDLTPLSGMSTLLRLNIAGTDVQDLTPLQNLKLERLTFTPDRIKQGIDVIRNMKTLSQIQPSLDSLMDAADFWKRYDLGVWSASPQPQETPSP